MRRVVVLAAVAVSLFVACGGHLPQGWFCDQEECAGPNVRSACGQRETCPDGTRCIQNVRSNGDPYAACAVSEEIDLECDRDKNISYCEGNTGVRCHGRYREEVVDCGDLFCVAVDSKAACVRSRDPDPNCDPDGGAFSTLPFCEGNALVMCFGPWAGPPKDCAEGEKKFCRGTAGEATCRLQPEPDPRCAGRAPNDRFYCDGDVAVRCDGEWRDAVLDCAAEGKRCQETLEVGSKEPHVRCQ